jgi:hypothetical protein
MIRNNMTAAEKVSIQIPGVAQAKPLTEEGEGEI